MEDSWDWYLQRRRLFIAAFAAGEIDYQQYVNMNLKTLREYLAKVENWGLREERDFILEPQ